MSLIEHCACGQLPAARQAARNLDALVAEFCKALGEPIPVDAIRRAQQLAGAVVVTDAGIVRAERWMLNEMHDGLTNRECIDAILNALGGQ